MGGAAAFSELVRCPGPAFSGIASSGTGTRPCSPTSGPADRAGRPGHFLKIYRPEGALCRPDLPWRWPFLDIFLYDLTGGEVRTRFESRTIFLPASHVLPPRPVLFAGSHRLAPACLLPVLRILYGDYETYRIKTYDHRRERPITLDDVVERVGARMRSTRSSAGGRQAAGGGFTARSYIIKQDDSGSDLPAFLESIDTIEAETGLDFFADLDDEAEEALESKRFVTLWGDD